MKPFSLFILFILLSLAGSGQDDPEAIKILDRFADISQRAPSINMKFQLTTTDLMEESQDTLTGSVIIKGDKFRLDLKDNITWFNGETAWNYLPAENEVTITRPDRKDESFLRRPSMIFSIYKKGYKCKLVEEKTGSSLIDLYPIDLKSDLVRIRLLVAKPSMHLISVEYRKKDGLAANLFVREYNLNQKADAAIFSFNPDNFKGVEIIDMR